MVIHIAIGPYRKETIMKKVLTSIMAVVLVMSVTGCNTPSDESLPQDEKILLPLM